MANNIYVGNRYVPVFANPVEWDNLREYEPLTIVTYNGTAYTSRQTVPVGTALSNTNYWVVTGNYNAQVEQYRQDVANLAERTSDLESDVATLTPKVNTNTSKISLLTNKRYVLIGDSYSVGTTAGGSTTGWSRVFKTTGGLADANCYISDNGGSGFIGTVSTKFIDLLNSGYANVNTPSTITDVVVLGGYNDKSASYENLVSAIVTFINRAKELYPNAKVWIGMVGYSTSGNESNRNSLYSTANAYWAGALNGANYIHDSELLLPSDPIDFMSTDEMHPTTTGYVFMGRSVYGAVATGSGNISPLGRGLQQITLTPASNISFNFVNYVRINRNIKSWFTTGNTAIMFTNPININGNSEIEIGTFSNGLFGNSNETTEIPARCMVYTSTFHGTNAFFRIRNKKLYLFFRDIKESGEGNFTSFTNVTQIYFTSSPKDYDARLV